MNLVDKALEQRWPLLYCDVVLPEGRLADRLRGEEYEEFRGETWLTASLTASVAT